MKQSILFFNTTKAFGGGEKWHTENALLLSENDYQISMITHNASHWNQKLEASNVNLFTINISNYSFINPFKMLRLYSLLKSIEFSTIIINSPKDLKTAGIVSSLLKKEKIIYRRGSAIGIKNTMLNRFLLKRIVTHIIANTNETAKTILMNFKKEDIFNEIQKKIHVIYNGIPVQKILSESKNTNIHPQIQQEKKDNFIIGNAGRLVHQKRQDLLIKLGAKLSKDNHSFKIVIAGEGKDRAQLEEFSANHKTEDIILFTGLIEDMSSFYKGIDLFVLTSEWEGFGYVLAEAMVFKIPVIAFDISSNPELIEDGVNGFLVKFGDIDQLKERIMQLRKDKKLFKKMGEAGFSYTLKKFDQNKSLNKLIELIEK